MGILMVASLIHWARHGSDIIAFNWSIKPSGVSTTARAIFNGICLGFLSVTGQIHAVLFVLFQNITHSSLPGFECTPAYIEDILPEAYGPVLRNLLYGALILNAPLMLLVYGNLTEKDILGGANVLSLLAERVAGRWLRYVVVIDAMLVLAGGVLTGIFTVCGLLERLARYK